MKEVLEIVNGELIEPASITKILGRVKGLKGRTVKKTPKAAVVEYHNFVSQVRIGPMQKTFVIESQWKPKIWLLFLIAYLLFSGAAFLYFLTTALVPNIWICLFLPAALCLGFHFWRKPKKEDELIQFHNVVIEQIEEYNQIGISIHNTQESRTERLKTNAKEDYSISGPAVRELREKPNTFPNATDPSQAKKERRFKPKSKNRSGFWVTVGAVLVAIRIIIAIVRFMNSNDTAPTPYSEFDYLEDDYLTQQHIVNEYPEIKRIFKEEKRSQKRLTEQTARAVFYVGDVLEGHNHQILETQDYSNYSKIRIESTVFPSRPHAIEELIPQNLLNENKDKDWSYLLEFSNPDFPNVSLKHRIVDGKTTGTFYQKEVGKENERFAFVIKSFSLNNLKFKAKLTGINVITGAMHIRKFASYHNKEDDTFETLYDGGTHSFSIDRDFIRASEIDPDVSVDSLYVRTAFRSLQLLSRLQLKEGLIYTMDKVYLPQLGGIDNSGLPINPSKRKKGYLKNFSNSKEDGIAYCSIYGDGFEMRYFIDTQKEKVIGFQIATTEKNSIQVILMEVFLEE